jgi:hypothetical protein
MEDITIGEAIANAKRQWLMDRMLPGESYKSCGERLGVSWRTILRWKQKEHSNNKKIKPPLVIKIAGKTIENNKCIFCGSTNKLELHHIKGKLSSSTLSLCKECHDIFHALSKMYVVPTNEENNIIKLD